VSPFLQDQAIGRDSWTIAPLRSLSANIVDLLTGELMVASALQHKNIYSPPGRPQNIKAAQDAIAYRILAREGGQLARKLRSGDPAGIVLDDQWARATSAHAEFHNVLSTPGRTENEVNDAFETLATVVQGDAIDTSHIERAMQLFATLNDEFTVAMAASQPALEGDGLL
jgi:hypothetical protein